MRIPWRAIFLLGAMTVVAIAFFVVRSNLRSSAFTNAVRSGDVATVRRLLAQNPDLMSTAVRPQGSRSTNGRITWRGRTVMHQLFSQSVSSSSAESIAVADALLAFGADFKNRLEGETLLHVAADAGDLPMMTWLLDKGADVNARNGCEHPVEALCGSGEFAEWQPFDRGRTAGGTVCKGCDREGQTPLHAAQRSIHAFEASALLLQRGADVHAVDAKGRTALHVAATASKASQDPRVLCAYGANPAALDSDRKTPAALAREAETATSVDRYSMSGPGELAGWLEPAGGCAVIAARARPGAPVAIEEVDSAWGAYVCTRDAKRCAK